MTLNEKNKPFLLILLTLIFLLIISMLPNNMKLLGIDIKPVDLFMDVKPDSLVSSNSSPLDNLFAPIKENSRLYTASAGAMLLNDLLFPTADVKISGNTQQMSYIRDALKSAGSQKVRIAHYGDSEIEGDLITADIRQNLQKKYGGQGAGFLSITSQDITFRTTTKHTFSDNWKTSSVISSKADIPAGISGSVAVPQANNSWVKYEATGKYGVKSFNTVRLFYTNAKKSSIKYSFNNGGEQSANLTPGSGVKELVLKSSGNAVSIKITATQSGQAQFYGVSLESGNGVYVDNFPWRGNSGISFRDIQDQVLKDFNKLLNYKMIILSFGGNMVNSQTTDYGWYETQMAKIVSNLKSLFPQTTILLVSVGDKSIKKGTKFVTDPSVLKILEVQKRVADKTGVPFWNMFDAMGGQNSMNDWVNANPPLAFKDYTHVTQQGAEKIAGMLTKSILQ